MAATPAGSLAEHGKRPLNINHKNNRYDDSIHAETKEFRAADSGRISSIPAPLTEK